MTKRLQVLLDDDEFRDVQATARRRRVTVAEFVRQSLRSAATADVAAKRRALDKAATYAFPTGSIEEMLAEIESGYLIDTPDQAADG